MRYSVTACVSFIIGLLLSLPAALYFFSMFLAGGLADFLIGLLKEWGMASWVRYNMDVILVGGPLLAFLVNLFPMLKIHRYASVNTSERRIRMVKNWLNLSVVILSSLALFIYLVLIIRWEIEF